MYTEKKIVIFHVQFKFVSLQKRNQQLVKQYNYIQSVLFTSPIKVNIIKSFPVYFFQKMPDKDLRATVW